MDSDDMALRATQIETRIAPSTNAIWSRTKTGIAKSPEYVSWLKEAGWEALAARPVRFGDAPVAVEIAVGPTRASRDVDSVIKPTLDLLQHVGVVENDVSVHMVSAHWDASVERDRQRVTIRRCHDRKKPRASATAAREVGNVAVHT